MVLGKTPSQVQATFGPDFEVIETGGEGTFTGYRYEKLGIIIGFDNNADGSEYNAKWAEIISKSVDIYGTNLGMSFSEIMAIRGKVKIEKGFVESPDHPTWYINYNKDGLIITYETRPEPEEPLYADSIYVVKA